MKINEQIWKKCAECGNTFLGKPIDQTCPSCRFKVKGKMSRAKKFMNVIDKGPVAEVMNGQLDEFEKVLEIYGFVSSPKKTVTSQWYKNSLNHQVKVMFDETWEHYSTGGEFLFGGTGIEDLRIYLEKTYGGEEKKIFWKEVSQ